MSYANDLFSSESVSEGHPDKWADQVSDPVPVLTFEQSFAAYERNDYSTAFAGFKKLAEQGGAAAQYNLGVIYHNGQGVPKDEQQAVVWYRKAAEQGDADAQYHLGVMYGKGEGFPKDNQSAYFWFLLASAQGHQNAAKLCAIRSRRAGGLAHRTSWVDLFRIASPAKLAKTLKGDTNAIS